MGRWKKEKKERLSKNPCRYCKHKDQRNPPLEVTDEKLHDSKMMRKLVKHVLNDTKNKIHCLLGDGAYNSNANFQYLEENRLISGIKIRLTLSFHLEIEKPNSKPKIFLNGKRRKGVVKDELLKLLSHPSKEYLVSRIYY